MGCEDPEELRNQARRTFDEVVDVYDEIRPSYPPALFDVLFVLLPPAPSILEVGPGTGQATRDLLARGASVHAVELGEAMARKLRANLPDPRLDVTVGAFEDVVLSPHSADAVFSATAYHWISPPARTGRPAAVLRPGGLVAIVDVNQVSSPVDGGFFTAAQPIYDRYGQGHIGPPAPERSDVDPPIRAELEADGRYRDVTVLRYDWDQVYPASAYRKLMRSYSGTQGMEERDRQGLLDDIEALVVREFGGRVTRPIVVTLTTAVLDGTSRGEGP